MDEDHGNEVQELRSALRKAEAELQHVREEHESRKHLVDILHEVMGNLPTEEIFHLLVRRLARALHLSHASVILANAGDRTGVVTTAFEQPQLHDLEIELDRYPEVISALNGGIPVLIPDLLYCPLYAPLREMWARQGTAVTIRSVMALPFPLNDNKTGVFLLRRTVDFPKFDASDVEFAETVVKSGVAAIQRAHAIETTRADNHRLEALAQTDPLTQLVNRRALTITLVTEMERVRRYNAPLAMLLVDLDHFKLINDGYGHAAGDLVLQEITRRMTDTLRSSDWVVRAGGEEFVVVLPETDLDGASVVAEKLRSEVAAHPVTSGELSVPITISVGYSAVATDEELERFSFDELLRTADSRLYEAKLDGRNRCKGSGVTRSGALSEDTAPKLRLQGAMSRAAKLSLLEP